jgi:hypothetical protein
VALHPVRDRGSSSARERRGRSSRAISRSIVDKPPSPPSGAPACNDMQQAATQGRHSQEEEERSLRAISRSIADKPPSPPGACGAPACNRGQALAGGGGGARRADPRTRRADPRTRRADPRTRRADPVRVPTQNKVQLTILILERTPGSISRLSAVADDSGDLLPRRAQGGGGDVGWLYILLTVATPGLALRRAVARAFLPYQAVTRSEERYSCCDPDALVVSQLRLPYIAHDTGD